MSVPANLAAEMSTYWDRPLQFVEDCFPWGESGGLEHDSGPDQWQRQILNDIGDAVRLRAFDGSAPVAPIQFAIASGHGIGKLAPKSLVIPTPGGNRQWGELQPGDMVLGGGGEATMIVARHENGVQPIYRVAFDDGSSTLVGLEHLWTVRGRQQRRNGKAWITITTADLLERGVTRSNGTARAKQWEIPIQGPAEFEPREIDLHPYFLGVWLGDGTKGEPCWTKPYPEIVDRMRSLGMEVTESDDNRRKRVKGISHLCRIGVFLCGSHERYIPEEYRFNSVENRRELLRGLLDSDGECNHTGSVGYSTTSFRLAEDVIWLVRSLGGKASLQPATKRGWYPDAEGERVECRDCYRVTINLDWNPFTLAHRKLAWKASESRYRTRWIESIEYSHDEDAMCITVENADGLYLANDFIVTHNSTLFSWLHWWIMCTRHDAKGRVTANTYTQLETTTWAEIQRWHKLLICRDMFEVTGSKAYHIENPEGWFSKPVTCAEENSEAFAGQHNKESTSFFLFDESSLIPDKIFEVAGAGLTDGEPMWFAAGNPTRNTGAFYDLCFGEQQHRWNVRSIDSRTCRFPNHELHRQWIEDHGIDSDYVRVRILGQPPKTAEDQLIGRELVDGARTRSVEPLDDDPLIAGVDVPDGGSAWFVVRFRRGLSARPGAWVPAPIRLPGERVDRSAMVASLARVLGEKDRRRRVTMMFVDSQPGAAIVERLHALGYHNVQEVSFAGPAADPKLYANKRAEMWGRDLKEWLARGAIDPEDAILRKQLSHPGFHYRVGGDGGLVVESKADMKKRGIQSPDDGDALALTFSFPVIADRSDYNEQSPRTRRSSGDNWMR